MRAFIVAATLGACMAVAPVTAGARGGSSSPAEVSTTAAPAPREQPSGDAERYAERERQAASQLENFDGGRRVVIAISGGTLLLIVLLVLLLA